MTKPPHPDKKRSFSSFKKQTGFVETFNCQAELVRITPRENLPPVEPTSLLRQSLARVMDMPLISEKIVSEALIFPV